MKTINLLLFLGIGSFLQSSFAQGRLVITGTCYGVLENNVKLVVSNPNPNAITSSATGGLITENEFDQIVWEIGTTTGAYVLPFVSGVTLTPIPFTNTIGTAGSGAGRIWYSTYPGSTWDNNVYKPSDVTHMFDYNTNSINNSAHVIDRFWIVDALGYGTKPSSIFTFTYRDSEHLQVGNTIVESNLGAQRFHPGPNIWGDYLPQGTTNAATNTTSGVPVVPADFWRSWTLSEVTNPLASDLNYYRLTCNENNLLKVSWQTLAETNISHFELILVNEALNSEGVVIVPANNIGSTYSYTYYNVRGGSIQLVEVDNNGNRFVKSTATMNCGVGETQVHFNSMDNIVSIQMQSDIPHQESMQIYDASGKLIHVCKLSMEQGSNVINVPILNLAQGIYHVYLVNESTGNKYTKKILKTN